jgi:Insertion element 4 transposase N-terminal/Transposase DDE domain
VGVLGAEYPLTEVRAVLEASGKQSERVRALPAEVMTYYVIALGMLMSVSTGEVLRVLREGMSWLGAGDGGKGAGKAAIAQARARLGAEPLRLLWERTAKPMAEAGAPGAFYRDLRLVALDGTTLDVPDTGENREVFGKPGSARGQSAFPQLRLVGLVETGSHGFFACAHGSCKSGEQTLATQVIPRLEKGMLCLADRLFMSFALWKQAVATGADLLWRGRDNLVLPVEESLVDGSYLSTIHPSYEERRRRSGGVRVRVIEYYLEAHPQKPRFRLLSTLLDPVKDPADKLAALYPERWEIEGAFDELKTHLRGGRVVLRSKTPALIEQELHGLLLAHRAVRSLMWRAARGSDPDRLSFTHTVRVLRRKLASPKPAFSP